MNSPHKRIPLHSNEGLGVVALCLIVAHLLLIILSWLLSATRLEGVRSLLSSEGIRWFIGEFNHSVASPWLVWLILLLISGGCLWMTVPRKWRGGYRDKVACRVSLAFLIIYVGIICLLTLMPHAILLSTTGSLFPSAFSRALVPIVAFGICLVGLSFGLMSGRLRSLSDILESLSAGLRWGAPLIVIYILFIQFYHSLRFVFG